jgi:hypothetical protein
MWTVIKMPTTLSGDAPVKILMDPPDDPHVPHAFEPATKEFPEKTVMQFGRAVVLPAWASAGMLCKKCGFFVLEGASWVDGCSKEA